GLAPQQDQGSGRLVSNQRLSKGDKLHKNSKYWMASAATITLTCLTMPVMALEASLLGDETTEIVVTATGQSTATSTTKTPVKLTESTQASSVISPEETDVRAVHTVSDALAYTAGVQAESSGIDSRVNEITVRRFGAGGFSSNNNFVDGLRLPSGGQWTRPAFD